ncbi:MAG TPA: class D sortase [Bryobacteraceae bacterium]|nr:class D sortase [Bryobacteraceae bacterium]
MLDLKPRKETSGVSPKCRRTLRWGEIFFLVLGFACLTVFFGHKIYEAVYQRIEDREFEKQIERARRQRMEPEGAKQRAMPRIPLQPGELLGRVVIPGLGLSAIVQEGVEKQILSRAVGHVPSTARPGEIGNVAIAAHRDTYFRPVRNLKVGDTIQLETTRGLYDYKVEKMWIVDPTDVSVLRPTQGKALTLITCYPFNFVGHAPKRYIVRAVEVKATSREELAAAKNGGNSPSSD